MKNRAVQILLIFSLVAILLGNNLVKADETTVASETTTEEQQIEERTKEAQADVQKNETKVIESVKAKVIEAGTPYERDNGSGGKETVQDVKLKILQGKEKSVIIFSTVRSKGSRTIGFLSDERRINVGLTRAKACLIVVGDSKTLMKDKNWDKLVRYSFRKGTFYKVKGNIKSYFKSFEKNYAKYQAKNEEEFTKLIYSGATGKEVDKS